MPRQNRVDPFGKLHAVPQRGTLMGNRGNLHDEDGAIVRAYKRKEWVACALQFNGRHRQVMAPGSYTELFFLDEATALAAGHRPCGTCRKDALTRFKACWRAAMSMSDGETVDLKAVDQRLHAERMSAERWATTLDTLPAGVIVQLVQHGPPHLWWHGQLLQWTFDGYQPPRPTTGSESVTVLTPECLVRVLQAGYPVVVHGSADTRVPRSMTHPG